MVFLDISSQLFKELENLLEFVQSTLGGAVNLREAAVGLGRLQWALGGCSEPS